MTQESKISKLLLPTFYLLTGVSFTICDRFFDMFGKSAIAYHSITALPAAMRYILKTESCARRGQG
ncbi:hypothetical protein [Nostoc sp. UHCC 0252]|uniref:hypothetical protein n=1 Tax=Nostoc sp. UHCC 0252 TaxID=3110241 RepID=UPI002B21FA2E|nr:hypothetical protein [Nostoc sp. UHCC 0252]MEA5603980.1 hypothetical protein [Nostoc sp. UHCC 0252]